MGCNCGGGRKLSTPAARPASPPATAPAAAQVVPNRGGAVSAGYAQTMNKPIKTAAPVKRVTV